VRYVALGASLSADGAYRYALTRRWDVLSSRCLVVVGLNPSTADAHTDDPTIRRCVAFAKREGCGQLLMLNLYALRSTDPAALWSHPNPIGPGNDSHIKRLTGPSDLVLAAWGSNARDADRASAVLALLPPVVCLGTTKDGHPRHPLYVRGDTPLVPWRRP
jgi:hypothetical protein